MLDLSVTNRQTLITGWEVISGNSNHEVIFANINIEPARCKPVKRNIYLWNKANFDQILNMFQTYNNYLHQVFNSSTPVGIMWESFKSKCKDIIKKNIPMILSSSHFHQSWINKTIKKACKKKTVSIQQS